MSAKHSLRIVATMAALFAFSTFSWAQPSVTSNLVAEKLLRQADGQLSTAPADVAKPGDLVVYTATYKNSGTNAARALVATLPVPAGMEYQARAVGDKLAPTLASLDGKTFAAIPLTRKVRAQGKELVQDVPLAEYRFLRWSLPELGAGADVSVKLTAKVSTAP